LDFNPTSRRRNTAPDSAIEKRIPGQGVVGADLAEIAPTVEPARHAVLLLDQAGRRLSRNLEVPANHAVLPLPAKCLELKLDQDARPGASVLISGSWHRRRSAAIRRSG
jgi:hypothetical protein